MLLSITESEGYSGRADPQLKVSKILRLPLPYPSPWPRLAGFFAGRSASPPLGELLNAPRIPLARSGEPLALPKAPPEATWTAQGRPRDPQGTPQATPKTKNELSFSLGRRRAGAPWGPQGGRPEAPKTALWTLPGPPWCAQGRPRGSPWAPRAAPWTPRGRPRTPKGRPRDPQGPRLATPMSPGAPQAHPRGENNAKMTPNRPPHHSKTVPKPPWDLNLKALGEQSGLYTLRND